MLRPVRSACPGARNATLDGLHGPLRLRFVGALLAGSAHVGARPWNRSTTEGEEVRGPGLERHVQAVRRELAAVTLKESIVEPVGELTL